MISLDGGEITALSHKTVSNEIQKAGPRIGYMPQETALIGELTVKETIYYFGNIFQMDVDTLRERYQMLKNLLELPPCDQRVEECSGGQARRVSFAAAMIHQPDLLLLDEPTVGLDPLLREKIWEFMLQVTRTSRLAIIITTHYIDEAKQADCVGLMRNGILLAEDTPKNIVSRYEVDNLEDAFLKLCVKHGVSEEAEEEIMTLGQKSENIVQENFEASVQQTADSKPDKQPKIVRKQIIKALLTKNLLQLKRQPA
jgi:ABC-type multidrug transport system ATPase subunit